MFIFRKRKAYERASESTFKPNVRRLESGKQKRATAFTQSLIIRRKRWRKQSHAVFNKNFWIRSRSNDEGNHETKSKRKLKLLIYVWRCESCLLQLQIVLSLQIKWAGWDARLRAMLCELNMLFACNISLVINHSIFIKSRSKKRKCKSTYSRSASEIPTGNLGEVKMRLSSTFAMMRTWKNKQLKLFCFFGQLILTYFVPIIRSLGGKW